MVKHKFSQQLRDKAKAEGRRLFAFTGQGCGMEATMETSLDKPTADRLVAFMIRVMKTRDIHLIPELEKLENETGAKKGTKAKK